MSRIELDISDDDLDKIIDEADDIEHDDSGLDVDDILQENEKEEAQHLATLKRRRTVSKGQTPESHRAAEKAEHPLTAIEKYEKDISYKLGGQTSLDSKFLLSNYRKIFDSNFTNVSFGSLEAIAKTSFNNASNLTPKQKKESWGTPKSIAVLPPKYIAIGTSKGAVLVFDYGQSGFHIINANNGQDFGAVTALDLSIRDDGLVCGFESGHITLWGISKNEHIKVIPPTENCSILAVKFWKDTRSNVIASNSQGFVYLYKLDSVFFQWVIDKKVLVSPDRRPTNSSGTDSNKNVPDGFLTIQVLKKEISEGHSLSRYSVVAMGSLKMVLVMTLEPEIHRVFKFDRPASISSFSVPSISWGKGALLGYENNRHPLLAVAWGNDLDIFQFQSVDEEFAKNIKYVASYNSKTELYHIEWISENNILAYDYKREFKLLYLSKFKSRLNMAQSQDFDYSEAETPLIIPDPDVAFDIYNYILENRFETSHQERPIMFFNNAIVGFPSLRRVFILGFSTVSLARHYDWKEYLEQLKNKADWLAALSFYVTLYKGTNKVFAGLPIDPVKVKEFIRPYSASLVRDYLTSISKANGISVSMNDMWKTAMLTIIDFLITVDNFEFLFRETKKTFEEWGMRDGFFEALEAFILRNRVKYVPNEPFRDLVDYYASTDKKDLLQYLIINLSLNTIDVDYAITVCMEFNLLTSLLYLCTHREGAEGADFLTPIARSLSTYQKSVEEQNPDKEEYGLKFLWILNMILQGRTFPDGEIPDHIWRQKVEDILFLVFEEMNVGLMLQIDPQIAFEIFYSFFEAKLSALLDSYDGTIQILDISNQTAENNGERYMNSQLKRILELFIETMGNRLQIQILALVYYCAKKDEEYHNMLYYMLADLTYKEKIKLPEKIMEECLLYLLKVPRELPPWGSSYKKTFEKHSEEENNDSAEDRSKLIVYLLKRLETKLGPEKIKGFAKLIEQSDFVDVKVYLSQIKHEYKKCFDMYLNQAQAEHRMKIFDWLDSVIHSLKDNHPEYFKDVKDSLLYRLRELVALNSEKTRNIILGLDRNLEVEAIKQLEPIPKLQLEYLKGMFANREAINTIPDDLLILHLRLLCQMEPKNVLKELESYPYPLDSSMKLCREYDVRDGLAFLLERAGNILESLRVTLGLFRMSLEEKLRKIEREKVFNESGTLVRKLSHAKEICLKYNKLGDRESDALWFSVLDSVLGCYHDYIANNKAIQEALKQDDNIPQNKAYRKLSKAFADYISNLFEDMTKCVAVESILAKLEDYSSLKLGDLKTSLLGVLRTYHYESNILEEARALLIGDMFDILGGVLYTTKQGSWTSKPNVPRDFIDTMAVFNCGHVFPRDCVKGTLCAVCADQESLKVNSVISQTKRIGAPGRNRPPPSQGSSREGGSSMNPQELLQQDKERLASAARVGYTFQDSGNKKLRYISKLRLYEQALQDDNDWEEDNYESYL